VIKVRRGATAGRGCVQVCFLLARSLLACFLLALLFAGLLFAIRAAAGSITKGDT
jgi:hypothetical protein